MAYSYDRSKTADSLPLHKPAEADEALGQAYNSLVSFKMAIDRMEEIPKDLHGIYDEIGKAISKVADARKHTTQVRMLARRMGQR